VTACVLSLGHSTGSHGIPFRNSRLLRTDYKALARELNPFFVDNALKVIFIYKGNTPADIDAFRFVYAAANDGFDEMPTIHAFSLSALARALELEPELCRPSLRSVSGLDILWAKLTEHVVEASLPMSSSGGGEGEGDGAEALEREKEKERAAGAEPVGITELRKAFGGEVPRLVPGKSCPPLPASFIPTYCTSCWYHQRRDVVSRIDGVHCAVFDAKLLYHRVQQMIQLSKHNKAMREKYAAARAAAGNEDDDSSPLFQQQQKPVASTKMIKTAPSDSAVLAVAGSVSIAEAVETMLQIVLSVNSEPGARIPRLRIGAPLGAAGVLKRAGVKFPAVVDEAVKRGLVLAEGSGDGQVLILTPAGAAAAANGAGVGAAGGGAAAAKSSSE
jgi:hypothetical protein